MVGTITAVAVVLCTLVILITLGKISRQLDQLSSLSKLVEKRLLAGKSREEASATRILTRIDVLEKQVRAMKGEVDWKDRP